MKAEDFHLKVQEIKSLGMRQLSEDMAIQKLKGEFFDHQVLVASQAIRDRLQRNLDYLSLVFKKRPSHKALKENMGCKLPEDLKDWIQNFEGKISTLRAIVILAMFYGVPEEDLMFIDMTLIPKHEFVIRYPEFKRKLL